MKKVIRLTESDLIRIVKKTINEMEDDREDLIKKVFGNNKPKVSKYKNKFDKTDHDDDYKDRSMYSPYYGDDEDFSDFDNTMYDGMEDEELGESSDKKPFNANKFLKMTKTALKNNKIELALNMSEDLVNDISGMSEVVTHLKRALSEIGKANDKLNKLDESK